MASVFFWIAAMATGVGYACLLGLNLVLVPSWLVMGMAVGVAARRASSWTCPRCGAEMSAPLSEVPARLSPSEAELGKLEPRTA